jgi:hypothetical protein
LRRSRLLLPILYKSARIAVMTASRTFIRCAATCLFVASLPAQTLPSATIQKVLPPDAMIIETANLKLGPSKARALVLWMEHPERVVWRDDPGYMCVRQVYGDHWEGPTRLSLVDLAKSTLVNTLEVRSSYEQPNDFGNVSSAKPGVFEIPFFVPNSHYHVPRPDAKREGKPAIMILRDLTGEGVAGQFVLFDYVNCGGASGSVVGYSPRSDRAVQYSVEIITGAEKPKIQLWAEQIFETRRIRPGQWDFIWEPGYGCFCTIHEHVLFDRVRQVFVDNHTVTPYPAALK